MECKKTKAVWRATTPTHKFIFDTPVEDFEAILISYGQGGQIVLTKTKEDLIVEEDVFSGSYTLTQEETSLFDASLPVIIEVKAKLDGGTVPQPVFFRRPVWSVLNEEVL